MDNLNLLQLYLKRNWPVLPLKAGSKVPATKHGHKDASDNLSLVKSWLAKSPRSNWGVVTGRASNTVVIDIDVKNGKKGLKSWKIIKTYFPAMYRTLRCDTPSGGRHYYYRYPKDASVRSMIEFLPGIDIKSDGGYVAAPPSKIDQRYKWKDEGAEIAELPIEFVIMLKHGKASMPPLNIRQGNRNEQIFKYCLKLSQLRVPVEDAQLLVKLAASLTRPALSVDEAENTLRSAYGYENSGVEYHLTSIAAEDLIKKDIPVRNWLAFPFLAEAGLGMIYAMTGIGKTWLAMELAYAIAAGVDAFDGAFRIEQACKILYIDGEMGSEGLQSRLREIAKRHKKKAKPGYLRFITADEQEVGIPDLATIEGQKAIEAVIGDAEIVIVDNLSCLVQSGKENEAEGWQPMQQWALRMKRAGVAILFIHHAGKNGTARGTSKRTGVLDAVIVLKRPDGHTQEDGASFIIEYEKNRVAFGKDVAAWQCQLLENGWVIDRPDTEGIGRSNRVIEAHLAGKSRRQIAIELGIGKSTAQRIIEEWQSQNKN